MDQTELINGVAAVAGRTAPEFAASTAAADRFAQRWASALAGSGRVAATVEEIIADLQPLTLRIAREVQYGRTDGALGQDIGVTLMNQGYGATEVVGPTVITLIQHFAEDFRENVASAPADWPSGPVIRQRLIVLAGAVADGFARATREQALAAQEEMQRAALAAVRMAETDRRTSENRFRALFAQTAVGIGMVNMQGTVMEANAAWAAMMGYTVEEMRGRSLIEIVSPGGSPLAIRRFTQMLAGSRDHFRLEITHDNRNGRRLYLDISVSRVTGEDGRDDFLVGIAVDITERKRLEDRLWHESRHDPLTGLPNRTLFFERLDELLTIQPSAAPVGVCYIDLDSFKSINDGLGHDVGDRLLVQVAARLRAAVTARGTLLARLGGDEFAILIDSCTGDAVPEVQAGRVLTALSAPITIDDRELTVSASVGVVDTATAGTEADGLMRAADISLYQAKARGRGRWERHDPHSNAQQIARHTLSTEISSALSRGEFFLEYQPLISLRDGSMHRVEALLRWRHPQLGLLSPDEFIDMAEENGLIAALGRWVLETACHQAAEWQRDFPRWEVAVNVNVAVAQLHDPGLVTHVRQTLAATGLPPHLLYLELTESAVLGEAPGPVDALTDLAEAGVRLVIDDFGTGYSNLTHLSRLPASELKIAGSFLRHGHDGDVANEKIVPAIISLAHSLNLTVTAEGIENAVQADHLRSLECDTAQGWFFASPSSGAEIAHRISEAS